MVHIVLFTSTLIYESIKLEKTIEVTSFFCTYVNIVKTMELVCSKGRVEEKAYGVQQMV